MMWWYLVVGGVLLIGVIIAGTFFAAGCGAVLVSVILNYLTGREGEEPEKIREREES